MKKPLIILAIFAGTLTVLFIVARMVGWIQFYKIPTGSNIPNIKVGDRIWASSLKTPKRLDFIVYWAFDTYSRQRETYCHRLVAIAGDTVVMRDGLLYVNSSRIDSGLNLNQTYMVSLKQAAMVQEIAKEDEAGVMDLWPETKMVATNEHFIAVNKIDATRQIDPVAEPDSTITAKYHKKWNRDQFGPLVVPTDRYFVMGDNRHNSLDSRYTGFIKKNDVVGTVLK